MAYLGALVFLFALWGAWVAYRHELEHSRRFLWVATWATVTPFLMNTAGWMLTEIGRQPWIVQGLMRTEDGVSPSVGSTSIWISLIVLIVLYLVLVVVDAVLMLRYARRPLPEEAASEPKAPGDAGPPEGGEPASGSEADLLPALTY